jgi:hypothetical protein
LCNEHNLEEKDIPRSLRATFEFLVTYVIYDIHIAVSLYFSELDEIREALRENDKIGVIKKMFLRKDLLRKVKQHDAKLSNVLQTFQVRSPFVICVTSPTCHPQAELSLDIRFAQLAEGLRVPYLQVANDSS